MTAISRLRTESYGQGRGIITNTAGGDKRQTYTNSSAQCP